MSPVRAEKRNKIKSSEIQYWHTKPQIAADQKVINLNTFEEFWIWPSIQNLGKTFKCVNQKLDWFDKEQASNSFFYWTVAYIFPQKLKMLHRS